MTILEQAYAGVADKWGDFDAPTSIMGPVISKKQMDIGREWGREGIEEFLESKVPATGVAA